jgi:hypothetical protein
MQRAAIILSIIPLLCMSCSDPVIDPSTSLVGATDLPPAKVLSAERIYITWGGDGGHSLTYDWTPNNVITVTHEFFDLRTYIAAKISQERLRVLPKNAEKARKLFWRMRPANLDGLLDFMDRDHRPQGCQRKSLHDRGEVRVAFISEGGKAEIDDDRLGVFRLHYKGSCNTAAAAEARKILRQALSMLPASKVAAEYEAIAQ